MSDLDSIFSEMSEISTRLDELPDDAFEERAALERRREELRARAAALSDSMGDLRPTAEIQAELISLRERLNAVEVSEIDVVSQHGGSGLEASVASDAIGINRRIEEASGVDQLQSRIRKLEQVLAERADG